MTVSRGLTLVELLVVIAVVGLLMALLLPTLSGSRESARRAQCANHLRQLGVALHNYESAVGEFPYGSKTRADQKTNELFRSDGVFANGFTLLLPFLEEVAVNTSYDQEQPWYFQNSSVAKTVIPVFNCPSNAGKPNPFRDLIVERAMASISGLGGTFGLTDYVFSKGASDSFCDHPRRIPDIERGMFDYNLRMRGKDIQDGLSKTLAIGEGAGGAQWTLCTRPGCTEPDGPLNVLATEPQPYYARQFWIGAGNTTTIFDTFQWMTTAHLANTLAPLNTKPVTHFLFDDRASLEDCRGTLSNPDAPSSHRVPGFRSDHPGGGEFLFADGSVTFLAEDMQIDLYRAYSTVAGGVGELD